MPRIPKGRRLRIQYFEQRVDQWALSAGTLGLDPARVAELASLTQAAREAYSLAQIARQKSRDATAAQNKAISSMVRLGSALISGIDAAAELSDMPNEIYSDAGIDPPRRPAPRPDPEAATNPRTELLNSGSVRIAWDGTIANGTFYTIWRQLAGETSFSQIGVSGSNHFDDDALPAGTPRAGYFIRTHRGTRASESSEIVLIRFGTEPPPKPGLTIAA
ncbi:MAG TPA: hypothetical protein ENJ00_01510 [Phycisphaerales bacterium]|nr:hypothetical protein [Phycisphaerales bacterium]